MGNPPGAKRTILVMRGVGCYKWYQSHSSAVRDGGANLIEDDESLRGGGDCNDTDKRKINMDHCDTLDKSHIGSGQERSLVHKQSNAS
ncbi:hypothetical protein Hdeb2414_s0016g00477101 [Helianthus debilis subsp. tardiflorus]